MGIIKDILYRFSGTGLLPLVKKQAVFPYYHLVRDEKVAHIKYLYDYKNVAQFRQDLDFLLANYKPASPQDVLNGQVPENSFLLTFDDGLEEIYSVIYPILKEKNLSAIFFINPDFVGNNQSLYKHDIGVILDQIKNDPAQMQTVAEMTGIPYASFDDFALQFKSIPYAGRQKVQEILAALNIDMDQYRKQQRMYISKEQIQEMIGAGFYFGGHTLSHPPLQLLSFDEQKTEIIGSMQWLKDHFGIQYSAFAFPFSDQSASKNLFQALFDYDPNMRIFGNAGIKKDIDVRIIQRFSLEDPRYQASKKVIAENLYKYFNLLTFKYRITRK